MATKEYRFGPTLRFDKDKESYIIRRLDALNKTHSLGTFMTYVVKLVFDDPSLLRGEENLKELMNYMENTGNTPNADKFFKESSKRIDELKEKVDSIHGMCERMYTLMLFDKLINPDKQVENVLSAEFILQRQIREIADSLGIFNQTPFASDKLKNTQASAEESLQFIIEHYEGIVSEIKTSQVQTIQAVMAAAPPTMETKPEEIPETTPVVIQQPEQIGADDLDSGDPLDFGMEDMLDLATMIGG